MCTHCIILGAPSCVSKYRDYFNISLCDLFTEVHITFCVTHIIQFTFLDVFSFTFSLNNSQEDVRDLLKSYLPVNGGFRKNA